MGEGSRVVGIFSCLFYCLGKASALSLIVKPLVGRFSRHFSKSYHLVDIWVFASLLIPVGFLLASTSQSLSLPSIILLSYGAWQLISILSYHVNVIIFDELRAKKKGERGELLSYRRSLILVLTNYIEIIFWFALAYKITSYIDTVLTSLHLSFVTMTNFGKQPVEPQGLAQTIVPIQSAIGFFLLVLILAYFVSLLPRRKSKDPLEQ